MHVVSDKMILVLACPFDVIYASVSSVLFLKLSFEWEWKFFLIVRGDNHISIALVSKLS